MSLTMSFAKAGDYDYGIGTLTKLQNIQDKIIALPSWLYTTNELVSGLTTINNHFSDQAYYPETNAKSIETELTLLRQGIEGNLISIETLKSRSQGILNLVRSLTNLNPNALLIYSILQLSVTLNLKNQLTSVNINDNMLSLTKDTVDDSSTVRVITTVTLIFLPANFVAVGVGSMCLG